MVLKDLKQRLRKCDFFDQTFSFFQGTNKAKEHKTAIGGLLTLLSWLLSALALIIFLGKLLDRSQAIVSVNTKNQSRNHLFNLCHHDIYLVLFMFDGVKFPKTEESLKYWTVRVHRESIYKPEEGEDLRKVIDPFPMVKCEDMYNDPEGDVRKAFSTDSASFYRGAVFCADILPFHYWAKGSPQELPYTSVKYNIYPCTLENQAECASPTELMDSSVIVPFFLNSVDFSNSSSPLVRGIDTDVNLPFGVITKTKITFWFKDSTIMDKKIDFFGDFGKPLKFIELDKVTTTIGTRNGAIHCTEIQIEDGNCDPYIEVELRASKALTIVERRYYTFLTMVSEVGGFVDLIFMVIVVLAGWYNERSRAQWIKNQLYSDLIEIVKQAKAKKEKERNQGNIQNEGHDLEERGHSALDMKNDKKFSLNHIQEQTTTGTTKARRNHKESLIHKDLRDEFDIIEFLTASKK